MRRGVSEYVVAPFGIFDLIRAIGDLYGAANTAPLGRTIGFFGAKGGCGASTVCHNVAWAIANNFKHDVVLADLDLPFGTAGIDFNQDPTQGIADALLSPERVDDVYLDRLLTKCSDHFNLLAAPSSLDRCFDLQETSMEPIIDTVRASVPAIVFDIPHMWTSWTRNTMKGLDEIVIVSCPDLAGLRNAKNLIDHLKAARPNDAPPRLLINMNGVPKRPEIKPEEFSRALELPLLAVIQFEPQLFGTASNNGQMIAEMDPKNPLVDTFRTISEVVMGKGDIRKQKKPATSLSFFSRFTKRAS
jgi:pilus assembly protein CpaE